MSLNASERDFLKNRPSALKVHLTILMLVIAFSVTYFYLLCNRFIPAYTTSLKKMPEVKNFIESGMMSLVYMSAIWITILLGFIIGSYLTQHKYNVMIDKLHRENK
ncbi:MAG: hypothetical protein PHI59_03845 [Candidatus Omnitrophica bacterium]|nr:hypothetical protein [Candidatus Omnitrophota bacterium]